MNGMVKSVEESGQMAPPSLMTWNPHGGSVNPTPPGCPQTSTHMPQYALFQTKNIKWTFKCGDRHEPCV